MVPYLLYRPGLFRLHMDGALVPEAVRPLRIPERAAVTAYLFHDMSECAITCLRTLPLHALETVLNFMGVVDPKEAVGPVSLTRLHRAEPPDLAGACLAVFCNALWAHARSVTMDLYEPAWSSTCAASDFFYWRYTYKHTVTSRGFVHEDWTEWSFYSVHVTDRSGLVLRRKDHYFDEWGDDYCRLEDVAKARFLQVETLFQSSGEEVLAVLKSVQQRATPHVVGYDEPDCKVSEREYDDDYGYREYDDSGDYEYNTYFTCEDADRVLWKILNVPWSRENDLLISRSRFRDVGGASARWLLALERGMIARFPCLEALRDSEGLSLLLPSILPYLIQRCNEFERTGVKGKKKGKGRDVDEFVEVSWEEHGSSRERRRHTSLVLPPGIWHDPGSEFRLICKACLEAFYWGGPHGQQQGGLLGHLKSCQACPVRNLRRILLRGATPPFGYSAFTTTCFDEACACEFPSWTEFVEHLAQAGDAHAEALTKEGYHQPMMDADGQLYLLNHQNLTVSRVTADECEPFLLGQWREWWGSTPRADGAIMPVCPSTTWQDLRGLLHHRGKDASMTSSKHSGGVARLIVERAERRAAQHAAQLSALGDREHNRRHLLEESHKRELDRLKRVLDRLRDEHAEELSEALRRCRAAEGAVACMTANWQ